MKTTEEIANEYKDEEYCALRFKYHKDGSFIGYKNSLSDEFKNSKWYSEEEIIKAIDKVLEIDDYEESLYNRLLKKELFGDEK